MNSGALILLMFVGSVTLVAAIAVTLFRFVTRWLGLKQVVEEGVVMTENGLEVLRFFGIGKMNVSYADVESVELLPHFRGPLATLLFRYKMSARWIGTRLFHEIVVIKLRGPRLFKYLLSTPKNGPAFVEQLKSRVEQVSEGASRHG
jgi:hypothetical protein